MADGKPFDELWGNSREPQGARRLRAARPLARRHPRRRARPPPAGRRDRLPQPRHHLRRLWRGRSGRADHPVRHRPAHLLGARMGAAVGRARAAGARDQRLHRRHLRRAARSSPTASIPADIVLANPQYLHPRRRRAAAARRLRPYLRDRPGPHRAGRILRARGQCPHAVGRLLHARESRGDAAALPGIVRHLPGPAGRFLSRSCCARRSIRSRPTARASRAACC